MPVVDEISNINKVRGLLLEIWLRRTRTLLIDFVNPVASRRRDDRCVAVSPTNLNRQVGCRISYGKSSQMIIARKIAPTADHLLTLVEKASLEHPDPCPNSVCVCASPVQ